MRSDEAYFDWQAPVRTGYKRAPAMRVVNALRRTRGWTPRLRFLDAIGRLNHGTLTAYYIGCPCDNCRAANTLKQREKRGGVYV